MPPEPAQHEPSVPGFPRRGTAEARVLRQLALRGPASRAHLAAMLGLSSAAVSKAASQLHDAGLVQEGGLVSSDGPGRPRTLLQIRSDCYAILGIDLARDGIRAVKVDLAGGVVGTAEAPYAPVRSRRVIERGLADVVHALMEDEHRQILAIGVGTPGPLDLQRGHVLEPPDFDDWRDVPLATLLEGWTGVRAWIERDANAAALGGFWFGAAGGRDDFAHVLVDISIGLGLVCDGRLLHGGKGLSNDLAHTVIDFNGPFCTCGSRGCLHMYASASALEARRIGGKQVRDAELEEAGRALGYSLVNLCNTFHPGLIVMSGIVVERDAIVIERAREVVASVVVPKGLDTDVVVSPLGRNTVALGSAAVVLEHMFGNGPYGRLQEPGHVAFGQEVVSRSG